MNNFTFYNPTKILFGKDTIREIGCEITTHGHSKILLIAGGGSIRSNGVYDQTIASLKKSGIQFTQVWGIKPNPDLEKALEIIDIVKETKATAILAIGGGSVIDTAKSVAAGFYSDDLWSLFAKRETIHKALDVFTILTISAAGSEMNCCAVLTNEETQCKWDIFGPALFPRTSIIDPSVQFTLPWHQTANGAVDAISHILEFYFMGKHSEVTLSICESLIKTIIDATDTLKLDPFDYNSRASLAWATTLALNGLASCGQGEGDWGTHAIEHCISAMHNTIPHAAGLSAIFPAWILYNCNVRPDIFERWAKKIWKKDSIENAVEALKEKLQSWGCPTSLKQLGVSKDSFSQISQKVMECGLTSQIYPLKPLDVIKILELAY